MKKKDLELQFAEIKTEFRIIKKLIYIILAALIGLILKSFWTSILTIPSITGSAIKNIFA